MLEDVDDTLDSSELKEIVHTEWDLFLGKLTQLLSKVFHQYGSVLKLSIFSDSFDFWSVQNFIEICFLISYPITCISDNRPAPSTHLKYYNSSV